MPILIFFVAHWYLSLFTQTFFLHRYAAHRMFSMSKAWEKVFYVLTFLFQGSSYLSAYAYGIMHRMHHAYADTEDDPHSPKYDPDFFSMMWRTRGVYNDIFYRKADVDERFTKDVPDWKWFDKFASSNFTRVGWIMAYAGFYVAFATSWWMFLLIPIHAAMGPFHGVIINWFAHKYGYINFKTKDTSKNLMPLDVFMMGEGYHNNHHRHGNRPNFGYKWYELDPTYPIILLLDKLRIIRLARVKSRA
ncbi:MAG: acyl-CoA desaturase [Saprospiraceae bacterium]|nr:acyl-CoA desaturase [Saprospiraceae bacterium]